MTAPRRALLAMAAAMTAPALARAATGTVYLTIDTGWGREAEAIAVTLRRREVPATLFLANEPSFNGSTTLSDAWAPFWRDRAAEGHAFATHTWRHWYFRADPAPGEVRYLPAHGGGGEVLDAAGLAAELRRPLERLREMAPAARILPLWRAPGGRTTPNALALAQAAGFRHQGWTAHGFWGDELDSARHPNAALARQAIERTRDGEVVVLHWGVRDRQQPFALVLDQVLAGLQARGLRFALLPEAGIA
jgi:peptidoglycan/xylan/chitin deacetylase (PgdA/CDA1 family)